MIPAALWWLGVATKVLGRDRGVSMAEGEAGRDIELRSRPSLLKLGVATSFGGRDLGRRPGRVATSARPPCARHAHAVRANWSCARDCTRRVLVVHTTRPGAVHCFVHCSGHCLDTVHEHCSLG